MTHTIPLEWSPLWAAIKSQPGTFILTTEEMYHDMLNALPPAAWVGSGFLVGEADHHNEKGEAVYSHFQKIGAEYFAKHSTIKEFRGQS